MSRLTRRVAMTARRVSAPVSSTWNPLDKNADITLTNGNLSAQKLVNTGFSVAFVRGTQGRSAGKLKFEATIDAIGASNRPGIGASILSNSVDQSLTAPVGAICWLANGFAGADGGATGGKPTFTTGDILSVEMDFTAGLFYLQKFGGARTAGIAFSAGTYFIATDLVTDASAKITLNTGGSAFAIAPTSGFTAWG